MNEEFLNTQALFPVIAAYPLRNVKKMGQRFREIQPEVCFLNKAGLDLHFLAKLNIWIQN